jgi:hypothetical protein
MDHWLRSGQIRYAGDVDRCGACGAARTSTNHARGRRMRVSASSLVRSIGRAHSSVHRHRRRPQGDSHCRFRLLHAYTHASHLMRTLNLLPWHSGPGGGVTLQTPRTCRAVSMSSDRGRTSCWRPRKATTTMQPSGMRRHWPCRAQTAIGWSPHSAWRGWPSVRPCAAAGSRAAGPHRQSGAVPLEEIAAGPVHPPRPARA